MSGLSFIFLGIALAAVCAVLLYSRETKKDYREARKEFFAEGSPQHDESAKEKKQSHSGGRSLSRKKLRRTRLLKRAILTALSLCIVGLVLIIFLPGLFEESRIVDIKERSPDEYRAMQKMAGRIMGGFVNRRFDDKGKSARVVVLTPPEEVRNDMDKATLEGLLNTISDRYEIVKQRVPLPDKEKIIPTANLWMEPNKFDEAVSGHADADLIISSCGLPLRANSLKFWRWSKAPPLALLNAEVYRLRKMFREEYIVAAVARNPWASKKGEMPPAGSKKNWLLITSENVAKLDEKYEHLFKKKE